MCTDYRKVNNLSKTDTFPIPRMDDCIDKIGNSKYITKFDLLKGFWQIPLTERAKEVSEFVTPDGLYHYKVMPLWGGRVVRRCCVSYITGASNRYWLTVGQCPLSL